MAGESYDVGSAFLQIVPSFDGVASLIDAQAAEWGESAGETFAESFKTIVNTELKDIDSVKIDADTSAALAKIADIKAEMQALGEDSITVTMSDEEVQAKLTELEAELRAIGAEHPEITVNANTGEAQLNLAALGAEVVALDTSMTGLGEGAAPAEEGLTGLGEGADTAGLGFDDLIASSQGLSQDLTILIGNNDILLESLQNIGPIAGSTFGTIESGGTQAAESASFMSTLAIAVAFLGTALVPIGGLFLGALAAVPALISGALAGFGALYAALAPVVSTLEAFSSSKAPTASSGGGGSSAQTAISNATAERDAAYSVEQATESLTNAQVNGAEAVTQAQQTAAEATQNAAQKVIDANQALVSSEQAVTQAQFNERQAQEAVIAARQQAANQLQDYTDQLADNAIAQQQDQLNLQEAQAAYNQAIDPGTTATYDQQQQAGINLEQAKQAITDLGDQNSQLQQTASEAFAAGIEGATGVVEAENQLQQATIAVANAIQQQGNDQTAANTAAQQYAQQQITNQQNIAKAQKENAQGVANAEKALEQALANQKSAFETAALPAEGASTAVKTYANDFAKLTPQGKDFVNFVEDQLEPAFHGISDGAQKALLPLAQSGLEDLLPFFKTFGGYIDQAAGGIGKFIDDFGKFASVPSPGAGQLSELFQNGITFMDDIGQAAEIFLEAFVGVGSQSKPIIDSLGTGLVNLAKAFNNWVNDGGFQGFLQWLRQNGPSIVSDISEFVTNLGHIFVDLAPIGVALDDIVGFLSEFVGWLGREEFVGWSSILDTISGSVELLWGYTVDLWHDTVTLGDKWSSVWGTIEQDASGIWNDIYSDLLKPIDDFFTVTIPGTFDTFVSDLKALPQRAVTALGDFGDEVWSKLEVGASWLETNVWDPIDNFFTGLPDKIGTAAEHMWDGIEAAFDTMLNALIGGWNDLHFSLPSFSLGPIHFGGETIGMPQVPLLPVPKYHSGGVVAGTPGVEQLAVLMPGETVLPAGMTLPDSLGGGGSPSLSLTIYGLDLTNREMVQEEVTDAFAQFVDGLQSTKVA